MVIIIFLNMFESMGSFGIIDISKTVLTQDFPYVYQNKSRLVWYKKK